MINHPGVHLLVMRPGWLDISIDVACQEHGPTHKFHIPKESLSVVNVECITLFTKLLPIYLIDFMAQNINHIGAFET